MKPKHSHRLFAVIGGITGIVLILAVVAAFWVYHKLCFINYTQYDYTESADALSNPYIGWYTIRGYLLAEDATFSLPETDNSTSSNTAASSTDDTRSDTSSASAPGLSLIEINLKNYADCDLTDTALTEIDSILSAWSQTGSQLILRFLYDWDGQNLESEPKELSQILTHMEQVGPIVNEYTASVYLLQGIFVGNWGEMNNSAHMGNGEMETLIQKLADVIDPSIFLSVRTPAQWRTIVGEGGVGWVSPTALPIGLYNDGMLGSANDTGTYGDKAAADADTNYSDAWRREDELAFQNELCRYVPNGGEVIIDNVYNDFENAIKDLNQMHVSYLNSAYDAAVLDKWKETIVDGMVDDGNEEAKTDNTNTSTHDNSIWNGISGYDYIERHLGYRYVLDHSSIKFHPLFDDTAILTVGVKNVGFSNCYRPLDVTVYVVSDRTEECVAFVTTDTDPRSWNSGETTDFTVPIDVRTLENDTYTLYLKCNDPALDRTILFANAQALSEYGYALGSIEVSSK